MKAKLSWNSAPQSVYQVEYTTNLFSPDWRPLMTSTNLSLTNRLTSILDSNISPADQQRFYRVRLLPQ
jgi:hypothetical protein